MADNRIRNCKISSSTHVFAMRISDPRLSSVETSSSRNGLISAANKRQKIQDTKHGVEIKYKIERVRKNRTDRNGNKSLFSFFTSIRKSGRSVSGQK